MFEDILGEKKYFEVYIAEDSCDKCLFFHSGFQISSGMRTSDVCEKKGHTGDGVCEYYEFDINKG